MITAVVAIAALVAMFMALPDQSSQPGLSDIGFCVGIQVH